MELHNGGKPRVSKMEFQETFFKRGFEIQFQYSVSEDEIKEIPLSFIESFIEIYFNFSFS